MAVSKPKSTPLVKAEEKVEEVVNEVVANEEVVNEVVETQTPEIKETPKAVESPTKKTKQQVDLKMMVPCRNITNGSLTYVSRKSGSEAHWSQFGDVEYIDVAELLTMKSGQPRFFNEPWIMIDDEEVVDYLGLRSMYDKILADNEVEGFFRRSVEDIVDTLKKAPNGTRDLVASKAREMTENQTLYDIRIIRALEKELTIDLSMVNDQ